MHNTVRRVNVARVDVSLIDLDVIVPVNRQFDASERLPGGFLTPDTILRDFA